MFRFILILLLACCTISIMAQNTKPSTNSLETVKSMEGFNGSSNIDYSTGLFNYSIPLFQIGDADFSYPITMSYTGKGVKVTQKNSQIGIGWSINNGGVITRIIRGNPDEYNPNGYFYSPLVSADTATETQLLEYYKKLNKHEVDGESDIYIASFGSQTVRFILQMDNGSMRAIPLEHTNVKIELETGLFYSYDKGWKITDEIGNIFIFRSPEQTKQIARIEPNNAFVNYKWTTTSWHLSEVITTQGKKVRYSYEEQRKWPEINKTFSRQLYLYSTPKMVTNVSQVLALINTRKEHISELQSLSSQSQELLDQVDLIASIYGGMATIGSSNFSHFMSIQNSTYRDESYSADIYDPYAGYSMQNSMLNNIVENLQSSNQYIYDQAYYINGQISAIDIAIQNSNISMHGEQADCASYSEIYPLKISSIEFDDKKLTFNYLKNVTLFDTVVLDVESKFGYLIDDISLSSKLNEVIKKVGFEYDLFNLHDKVLLDSVTFKSDSIPNPLTYSFNYKNPGIYALGADYWGYFSGRTDQENGLPNNTYYFGVFNEPLNSLSYTSAFNEVLPVLYDRIPDSTIFDNFSLSEIKLITGGSLRIEYEPNQLFVDNLSYQKNVLYGGQRVKSLIYKDPITQNADTTFFKYQFFDPSDGHIKSSAFQRSIDGFTHESVNPSNYFISSDIIRPAHIVFDPGNEGIIYSYVEEITKTGSVGYKYLRSPDVLSNLNFNHKFHPYWLDNLLLAKIFYTTDGKLVRVERNKYSPGFSTGNEQYQFKNSDLYFNDEQNKMDFIGVEQRRTSPYDSTQFFVSSLFRDSYMLYLNVDARLKETQVIELPRPVPLTNINYTILSGLPSYREYDYERVLNDSLFMSDYPKINSLVKYRYTDDKYNLIRSIESFANGRSNITRYKYPQDYRLDPLHWTKGLVNANKVSVAVEEQQWIKNLATGDVKFAAGVLTEFRKYDSAEVSSLLPYRINKIELSTPLEMTEPWVYNDYNIDTFSVLFPDSHTLYKNSLNLTYSYFGNAKFKPSVISDLSKGTTQQNIYDFYAGQKIFSGNIPSDSLCYALGFNNISATFFRYKLKRDQSGWLNNVYFYEPFFLQDHPDIIDSISIDLNILFNLEPGIFDNEFLIAAHDIVEAIKKGDSFTQIEPKMNYLDSIYERSVYDLSLQAKVNSVDSVAAILGIYDFASIVAYLYAFHYHCTTQETFNEIMQPALMSTRLASGETIGYFDFRLSLDKLKQASDSLRVIFLDKAPNARQIFYRLIDNGSISSQTQILLNSMGNFNTGSLPVYNISASPGAQLEFRVPYYSLYDLPSLVVTPDNSTFIANVFDKKGNLQFRYDQNLMLSSYEYDDYNRLVTTRDKEGAILNKIAYGDSKLPPLFTNVAKSANFTKNSCGLGYIGSSLTFTVPAGKYGSDISQVDADQKAQADLDGSGQAFANDNGTCIRRYSNVTHPFSFRRNNCGSGYSGTIVNYTVPAGTYTSLISQEDAEDQAENEADANGQTYANTYGDCGLPMVTLTYDNFSLISGDYVWLTNSVTSEYYMLDMTSSSGTLGEIPEGNYMVYITNYAYFSGNPSFYPRNFEMGSYSNYDYEGFFYGVTVDSTNSHIVIY